MEDGTTLPLDVKAGDRILFGKYSGTDIILEGEDYLIMREDEVLGTVAKAGKRTKAAA
jgi:chaperonin GroES